MHILVVEDDFISRRLLCRYLEPYGECDVAVSGEEAVAAVFQAVEQGRHYDLICLDIMMPGINGHEALQQIREYEAHNGFVLGTGAKVIMTTSIEDHNSIRDAFTASADGYVVKPIVKKKFLETLNGLGLQFEIPL